MKKDTSMMMTEGPIWRRIIAVAIPVFIGNVFQQLYNTVDSLIVGNFIGKDALAAVSSSGSLIFLMVSFFNGVAMGAGVIIARYYGARDYTAMRKAIHTAIAFGLVTGAVLTVAGVALTPVILRWMGTPAEVLPQSIEYFRYYFCGAIFTVMYNIFVGILHAVGDSKHPLYYLIFSTFVNIALDMLLVAGLGFGVGAAAIATTISQGVSAALCLLHVLRVDAPYRVSIRAIRFHKESLFEIIRYGLPSGIQNSVIALANVVVQTNLNSFGKAAVAGCGAYSKLEGFAFLPVTCFTQALATFVGQNLGAGNIPRIRQGIRAASGVCLVISAVIAGIMIAFGRMIVGMFMSGTPEETKAAIDVAYKYLTIMAACLPTLYLLYVFRSTIQGMGNTVLPRVSGIAEFIMRICAALLLPLAVGEIGLYYAEVLAWIGADFILIPSYFIVLK